MFSATATIFCSADFHLAAFFLADVRPATFFRRTRQKFGGWGLLLLHESL